MCLHEVKEMRRRSKESYDFEGERIDVAKVERT